MNAHPAPEPGLPEAAVPEARVVTATEANANRWRTKLWWLTAACVLIALGLVISSLRTQGTILHIRFEEGHGLKAGDAVALVCTSAELSHLGRLRRPSAFRRATAFTWEKCCSATAATLASRW